MSKHDGSHLGQSGKPFENHKEFGGAHGPVAEQHLNHENAGTRHKGLFPVHSFGGMRKDDNSNYGGKDGC